MDIPNPGSDEAIDQGCTCPVLDNGHGNGVMMAGIIQFWISSDCPLHGEKSDYQESRERVDHEEKDNIQV